MTTYQPGQEVEKDGKLYRISSVRELKTSSRLKIYAKDLTDGRSVQWSEAR